MSQLGTLEAGSRHDLRVGLSPDAPDEAEVRDDGEGAFGYVHSYETSSRYDGPGVRVVLFVSGCLLRCTYCHNPDTWHLKDGTYVSVAAGDRPAGELRAGAARARRRPDHLRRRADGADGVHPAHPRRRQGSWACTPRSRPPAFSATASTTTSCRNSISCCSTSRASDPETYSSVTGRDLAPTLRFAERLAAMGKPVWVRFTLVPGLTDDPGQCRGHRPLRRADEERRVGGGAAVPPARRLQVEGDGPRLRARRIRQPPTPDLIGRVIGQFRAAGCNVR